METTYTKNLQYLPKHKKWRVQKSNVAELHRVDNGTHYDEGINLDQKESLEKILVPFLKY